MARRKSSRTHPKYKTRYRVRNWREHEATLRTQGDVMLLVWSRSNARVISVATS